MENKPNTELIALVSTLGLAIIGQIGLAIVTLIKLYYKDKADRRKEERELLDRYKIMKGQNDLKKLQQVNNIMTAQQLLPDDGKPQTTTLDEIISDGSKRFQELLDEFVKGIPDDDESNEGETKLCNEGSARSREETSDSDSETSGNRPLVQ